MKTINLEVHEKFYDTVISFLRLLPEQSVHVLEDEDGLSQQEQAIVQRLQQQLSIGDDSEFEDWDSIKASLK